MGERNIPNSDLPDKAPKVPMSGLDAARLGLTALHALGGVKADLALTALEYGKTKMLEALLPYVLVGVVPTKLTDPDKFKKDGEERFGGLGEAMNLVNRKIADAGKFVGWTAQDEARLRAFWIFPKANDRANKDPDQKLGLELAYRKFLEPADRTKLDLKELTPAEELKLAVLTRKNLLERQTELAKKRPPQQLDKDEQEELANARQFILNRAAWADLTKDNPDKTIAAANQALVKQANEAIVQEMDLALTSRADLLDKWRKLSKEKPPKTLEPAEGAELSRCNKLVLNRDTWNQAVDGEANKDLRRRANEAYLEIITDRAEKLGLDKTTKKGWNKILDFLRSRYDDQRNVKPGMEDAVLAQDGEVVKDKKKAQELVAEGKALTPEQLQMYYILGFSKYAEEPYSEQVKTIKTVVTNLTSNPRAGEGGSDDPTLLGGTADDDKKDKKEVPSFWEFLKEVSGDAKWSAGITYAIVEGIGTIIALRGKGWPFPVTRALVKGLFWNGPKGAREWWKSRGTNTQTAIDDSTSRLRDDKMSQDRVRTDFKTEAEAAIRGLDPKHPNAGKKLSKMMNDFAAVEKLDPRVEDGRLKVEVKFSTDPVTESNGMLKGKLEFSGDKVTLTFPADAKPGELAHDCHLALYEIGRSGKGDAKALKVADRAAITRMYERLGVDFTGRSDASARDASSRLPDRGTGASTAPIEINFTADGVTIAGEKFTIDKVTEAIRDELKEKVDKLERDGKKAGDAEYDAAKKAYNEHRLLAEDLARGGDRADAARTRALDKVKSAFEADDGKLAERFREDLRKAGGEEKGRSRAVVLSMLAARFAAPTAAVLVGVGILGSNSARAAEVKRAPIVPIIIPKKEDK